jgi:hypothetical protein
MPSRNARGPHRRPQRRAPGLALKAHGRLLPWRISSMKLQTEDGEKPCSGHILDYIASGLKALLAWRPNCGLRCADQRPMPQLRRSAIVSNSGTMFTSSSRSRGRNRMPFVRCYLRGHQQGRAFILSKWRP